MFYAWGTGGAQDPWWLYGRRTAIRRSKGLRSCCSYMKTNASTSNLVEGIVPTPLTSKLPHILAINWSKSWRCNASRGGERKHEFLQLFQVDFIDLAWKYKLKQIAWCWLSSCWNIRKTSWCFWCAPIVLPELCTKS